MKKRISFKMFLKPGFEEEYEKRHSEIWPELKALLKDSGVSDYTIYWDKDTNILFAHQVISEGAGSQDLGDSAIVQQWWKYMADIMETKADYSPKTILLQEVFHLD
ncbi:L-rhamnose mutarotase [Chryseobacterium sp. C39-AII1]|uniref:L-rhamnose mutarotase n=1 Tax=Chryseobacterium sp. C39-AII1 TaxID=3080332 RepID=UPI00320858BF